MDIKVMIQKTSYYGYYFGAAITIYSLMNEVAYVLTENADLTIKTFLFPLLCLVVTLLIKKIGVLKDE